MGREEKDGGGGGGGGWVRGEGVAGRGCFRGVEINSNIYFTPYLLFLTLLIYIMQKRVQFQRSLSLYITATE